MSMAASHQRLELLTQVLGGIALGSLLVGRVSLQWTSSPRLGFLRCCRLLLRGSVLLAGLYLLAGTSIVNLALCTLGVGLAGLEMRRLSGGSERQLGADDTDRAAPARLEAVALAQQAV
ncbi:hypothetical protein SNE35_24060 [Paucibacter sp. R3-3]|uniref:Uncharacterized protein n=1 Tax=Roseateles agri TaxID=3098619 RepID=A0ABU5DQQ1_9BURK|nr:hypothetical protein [Paucibacter sp. R3-3]MDY0747599.1 hypothetical protein [Paucibacter sp. R3-3]